MHAHANCERRLTRGDNQGSSNSHPFYTLSYNASITAIGLATFSSPKKARAGSRPVGPHPPPPQSAGAGPPPNAGVRPGHRQRQDEACQPRRCRASEGAGGRSPLGSSVTVMNRARERSLDNNAGGVVMSAAAWLPRLLQGVPFREEERGCQMLRRLCVRHRPLLLHRGQCRLGGHTKPNWAPRR